MQVILLICGPVMVTILANILLSPEPANILVAPINTVVNISFDAVLTCEAFGVPTPTISWSLPDGTAVYATSGSGVGLLYTCIGTDSATSGSGSGMQCPRISAETSTSDSSAYRVISRLSVDNTEPGDAGTYTCVAVNGVENLIGVTGSATATLTVQGKSCKELTRATSNCTVMITWG